MLKGGDCSSLVCLDMQSAPAAGLCLVNQSD